MALTASYDPVLSRIRLVADNLGATATRCVFWRTTTNFARYVTLRGGWPAPVTGGAARIDDYEFEPGLPMTYRVQSYTSTDLTAVATFDVVVTQDLDVVWLKVPAAPYLNRQVEVSVRTEVTRRSRGGVFDVVGRTYPVAVGDVRSSRQFTLQLRTETAAQERDLDYTLAAGEVIYLQAPSVMDQFPGGYYSVGDVARAPEARYTERRVWVLPLTEVAAPGPAVIGSTYTISSMLAEYATITAVIAGNATINDLLERVASPSDVIVG
jgi:hypothetical protein